MQPWPYPFWLAHRGAGKIAPENTLAAFRTGASLGFRGFECDVKLSADGVLYLLHDDDLDRTTNAAGPAKGRAWQDLSHLDAGSWLDAEFAGEPPATLEAIATFCDKNHCAVNLEIKPCPGMEDPTGQAVARWVAQHWPHSSPLPLLSSFEVASLNSAQAQAAYIPRALLLERLDQDWLGTALELGCCAVVLEHTQASQEAITQAHAQGLRVLAYTVNELQQAQRLRAWGIDGLITDNMGLPQR
jgi:glycerophosphoryl diester phosphodiesterase